MTPLELRHKVRSGEFRMPTAGCCGDYAQANLVILPRAHADAFLLFCQRNPRACPLLAVGEPGQWNVASLGADITERRQEEATMKLLQSADTQEDQLHYVLILRGVKTGWTPELRQWQARVALLRRLDLEAKADSEWPDVSDAALLDSLEDWLMPYLGRVSRLSHFANLDLSSIVRNRLPWPLPQRLDELAPRAGSGHRVVTGLVVGVAAEGDGQLADALDQLEGLHAFLFADGVAEDAAQQPDVLQQGAFVFLRAARGGLLGGRHAVFRRGARGC